MCNHYTGEHTFIYSGDTSTTAVSNIPWDWQRCQCGQFTWGELNTNKWRVNKFAWEQGHEGLRLIGSVRYSGT